MIQFIDCLQLIYLDYLYHLLELKLLGYIRKISFKLAAVLGMLRIIWLDLFNSLRAHNCLYLLFGELNFIKDIFIRPTKVD